MEYQDINKIALNISTQSPLDNTIHVNQKVLLAITEKISTDKNCKFRQTVLVIFNHLLASMDNDCKVEICARQLSTKLGVHYDTVTKCIKYLKQIEVLKTEK